MKATIVCHRGTHQELWGGAMRDGLKRHGIETEMVATNTSATGDFVVCWGWRTAQKHRPGRPVLVLERGYVGDRFAWTSAGWNGLNGRATFPQVEDGGERWRRLFGHLLEPWNDGGEYVLLIGQVRGDSALERVNIARWYAESAVLLGNCGLPVLFRPHPVEVRLGHATRVDGVPSAHGPLGDALAKASLVCTYNSNAGVDAALAGVPVIACDEGSMAWPVAAHGFEEPVRRPDRSAWCERMAWCQWSEAEMRDGTAWEHLKACL